MNVQELNEKLNENVIPKNWYLINEGTRSDTHILEEYSGLWKYYYIDEKDNKRNECHFRNESKACHYLFDKMIKIYEYFGNSQK